MSASAYGAHVGSNRTFIVRVSEAPRRVVVEDVRERRRAIAAGLGDVGAQIEAWLGDAVVMAVADPVPPAREDSVSGGT